MVLTHTWYPATRQQLGLAVSPEQSPAAVHTCKVSVAVHETSMEDTHWATHFVVSDCAYSWTKS